MRRLSSNVVIVFIIGMSISPALRAQPAKPSPPAGQPSADKTPASEQPASALHPIEQRRRKLEQETELLRKFAETLEQIQANYVDEKVSEKELIEAAIRGMMSKLDPYSNYIGEDDVEQFRRGMEPYAGIGVEVTQRGGTIHIVRVFLNYAAWKAGLRSGDQIVKIGDTETRDLSLTKAVKLMSGKPGSKVKLTVLRAATRRTETLELTREVTRRPMVLGFDREPDGNWDFYCDHKNKIAYVRISTFGRGTTAALRKTLSQLIDERCRGLVLDLRFNPGGLLSEAVGVCELFVREGKIVSTEGRSVPSRTWTAHSLGTLAAKNWPVAVLVNRFSASAAEIVSACLQDHHVGVIVGERTFGKGSVQNVISLDGGQSAMKLTTASYHRPSGKNIHRLPGATPDDDWGVQPDDDYRLRLPMRDLILLSQHFQSEESFAQGTGQPAATAAFADRQMDLALSYLRKKLGIKSDPPAKKDGKPPAADKTADEDKKPDAAKQPDKQTDNRQPSKDHQHTDKPPQGKGPGTPKPPATKPSTAKPSTAKPTSAKPPASKTGGGRR